MSDFSTLFDTQPTFEQLSAAFDELEADITYIDDKDIVRYFSPFRIFERHVSCLDQPVLDCHPDEVFDAVDALIDSFRKGEQDRVTFESVMNQGRPISI
ncbi:MAG: PAS domain-containing protein [Actinomycetia bacterium]|nr:PAS domain-containing protein [Actinomycetes bacterium]